MAKPVRIALVGGGFAAHFHLASYEKVYGVDFEVVGLFDILKDKAAHLAKERGVPRVYDSYEQLLADKNVDVVDVVVPNFLHVPTAVKAAQAGKHVFCEKPLATNLADAKAALAAVKKAGVINMICHNYRRAPAISLAKRMIANGDLGEIYHWRALYLQDWLMPPDVPMMWRVQKAIAGSGSLGDLMAHSIDLALWMLGDIETVACTMKTFIKKRPKLEVVDTGLGGKAKAGAPMGTVDVDDGVVTLAKFANGALGTFEATRFAAGHKNYNWFEVNGSKGSLIFNLERMNELQYYNCADPADRLGFRLIQATANEHPFMAAMGDPSKGPRFWPVAHIIGYEHTFINTVFDLCNAVAQGKPVTPNFEDAVRTQAVLDACERASKEGVWAKVKK